MTERSERVRREVLGATLELLGDDGVERLTIESVSARSGVAKTTIYRHWPTKFELVIDAVGMHDQPVPTPDTGELRSDLYAYFATVLDMQLQARMTPIIATLLDAAQRDPEYARLHERLSRERTQPLRTLLELAQLRGHLGPGVVLDDCVEMLLGPLLSRALVARRQITEEFLEFVVETFLAALATER